VIKESALAGPSAGTSGNASAGTPRATGDIYVIAGDWVVDENWFLVRHHSDTSKHTGDAHYRRLESREQGPSDDKPEYDKILNLCGAGFIARVLYKHAVCDGRREYSLRAIGRWQGGDTTYLSHLVHSGDNEGCEAGRLGYRLVQPALTHPAPAGITLQTLDEESPTIRAIRLYHRRKDGWHIVNRVDWEPPADGTVTLKRIARSPHVRAVVLDDLQKGTVTDEFVKALHAAYPNAWWYVRAKERAPSWLEIIRDSIALFVIGPEVAFQSSPFERWHEDGSITAEAMEVLESVGDVPNVLLLSEHREVLGKFEGESVSGSVILGGRSSVPATAINQIGWADAFMAGLVHEMAPKYGPRKAMQGTLGTRKGGPVVPQMIHTALGIADQNEGASGVPGPRGSHTGRVEAYKAADWEDHKSAWNAARRRLGLIESDGRQSQLHVWRGASQLKDYIACIEDKRRILDDIGGHLRSFSRGLNPRSLGILVQADPGTGKSHLARCLAKAFDFDMLSCDISQMVHREEIFNFFDLIATRQAQGARKVLVFVDEINASIEGNPAYGAFLSPLEGNRYARRGHEFTLQPCVWFFTGTKISHTNPEDKGSDFMSRMTLMVKIDYQSLSTAESQAADDRVEHENRVRKAARLEQVYFGATMINQYFPDVLRVERGVLKRFHDMEPEQAPFRVIRQMATSLRNVKHGTVHLENLADFNGRATEAERKLVQLVFQPQKTEILPAEPPADDSR
jgi:hypothetical protein